MNSNFDNSIHLVNGIWTNVAPEVTDYYKEATFEAGAYHRMFSFA
jgi:hypothetical protein